MPCSLYQEMKGLYLNAYMLARFLMLQNFIIYVFQISHTFG